MIRMLMVVGVASLLILATLPLAALVKSADASLSISDRVKAVRLLSPEFLVAGVMLVVFALLGSIILYSLFKKSRAFLDADAEQQTGFLDNLDPKYVDFSN